MYPVQICNIRIPYFFAPDKICPVSSVQIDSLEAQSYMATKEEHAGTDIRWCQNTLYHHSDLLLPFSYYASADFLI